MLMETSNTTILAASIATTELKSNNNRNITSESTHEIQRRYQILVTRILSRESKTSSNSSKCMTRYVFHVSYILFYFNSTLDFVLCLLETCWRLFWSRVIHSHSLLRFVILKQWLGCGVRAKLHVDKSGRFLQWVLEFMEYSMGCDIDINNVTRVLCGMGCLIASKLSLNFYISPKALTCKMSLLAVHWIYI